MTHWEVLLMEAWNLLCPFRLYPEDESEMGARWAVFKSALCAWFTVGHLWGKARYEDGKRIRDCRLCHSREIQHRPPELLTGTSASNTTITFSGDAELYRKAA